MNLRVRLTPDESRERIVAVAEEMFRRVGYAKTAVSDIAAELGMSPANIYRFFASKGAINDVICQRICADSETRLAALIDAPMPAAEKLRALILGVHEHHGSLLSEEKRMHEMVAAAMTENWGSIEAHCNNLKALIGRVVAEGVAAREFDSALDLQSAGKTIFGLCCGLFHPTIIAECARKDEKPDPEAMVRFILRALAPR
jgi:AcrR family transcriptional regulator